MNGFMIDDVVGWRRFEGNFCHFYIIFYINKVTNSNVKSKTPTLSLQI